MKRSGCFVAAALLLGATACGGSSSGSAQATQAAQTTRADQATPTTQPAKTAVAATAETPGAKAAAKLAGFLQPAKAITVTKKPSAAPKPGVKVAFIDARVGPAPSYGVGIKAASEAIGWQYTNLGVDLRNPATVNSAVLQAIDGGAQVIITAALDQALMQDALTTAKKRGIVVIDAATSNSTGQGITAIIGSTGQAASLWAGLPALQMIVDSGGAKGKADIALVYEPQLETVHRPNLEAVKAELKNYCPDTCSTTELGVPIGDVQGGKGPASIISFLQKSPDVDYLYLAGPELAIGLPAALQEAGLKNVKFLGSAPDEAAVQETAKGNGAGWGAVPFVQWGWQLVDAAIRAVNGDDISVAEQAGIPIWLVNPANAAAVTFENRYPSAPAGYQDQYKALWGV